MDTAVLMYAAGQDHPLRAPCVRIIQRVRDGEMEGVISTEVIQEILHRFVAIRRPDLGAALARDALDLFAPVLPVTHAVMHRMPALVERYPALAARDLVHVATCLEHGISAIVSPDRGFDVVSEVRRLSPEDV
ncbi:MAG TPA: type II toxin-antitoxin system VapC family toxin [Gammaproteobacteria bacterium]|nr:type II toxin-antitoxin system VapC family toxin [Gammaproteobacteria bacterium]